MQEIKGNLVTRKTNKEGAKGIHFLKCREVEPIWQYLKYKRRCYVDLCVHHNLYFSKVLKKN